MVTRMSAAGQADLATVCTVRAGCEPVQLAAIVIATPPGPGAQGTAIGTRSLQTSDGVSRTDAREPISTR